MARRGHSKEEVLRVLRGLERDGGRAMQKVRHQPAAFLPAGEEVFAAGPSELRQLREEKGKLKSLVVVSVAGRYGTSIAREDTIDETRWKVIELRAIREELIAARRSRVQEDTPSRRSN